MRFLELDALRGIASLTVLLFHFTRFSSGTSPFNYNIGATGVDFFFMLSGFVILMTLDKKPSVGQFFWGRITRIVPTYWACATVTLIAIYTFTKKDFGIHQAKEHTFKRQLLLAFSMSLCIGFYDGFIGPGTGSFFVLAFVVLLGFEFVQASAYAKFVNCMTNFSAVMVFVKQGNYVLSIAILMAVCNVIGNVLGSVLALKKGNAFVRIFFLLVVSAMIIRYSYMIFFS